ncbi:MAG: LuxR family transcriptional regulator [Cohnella sp.]|nr:LuxR family transcriptional regulator [Cohnella sp.]
MNRPILATKFYIPLTRTKVVPRRRLIERLNEGLDRKLTLVSAPVGFGKTTLVGEWVSGCGRPVAWLSLEEGDDQPARFLTLLIAALQTVADRIGAGVVHALQSRQPPALESALTDLINEIAAVPYPFLIVLDDYHALGDKQIDDALDFLLEHLPPSVHLVIATRENPQLPLGRLRARGQLTECRAADLRFTAEESAAFLNQVMNLRLTADEITALETRTEGWIAGLQLAALSMQGREDPATFIRAFAGDHRYIVDYLVEEVLQRQSDAVRSFLLRTSILDRLHGPLCDAVTGLEDGSARLKSLEQGNFFVVPLDDSRQWYRYHHLFAEVLSSFLKAEYPDQVAELHARASKWYERHGYTADAIRHALVAKDFERAADLIEPACPAISRNRQEAVLLGWLNELPALLFRRRPVLSVCYAGALLGNGRLERVEDLLQDAQRWLEAPSAEMVVVDEEEFRRLPGAISVFRAAYALARGDVPSTMRYARHVLEYVPEDDYLRRGAAAALVGLAHWTRGELEEAYRMFADGMANVRLAGNISDAIGGLIALADIRIAQGRLRQAASVYEQGLRLAVEHNEPEMRGTADMYVGLSELCRERNDLVAAERHLRRSEKQGEHTGFPQYRYRWRVAMARIREAQGDRDAALDLLSEAERAYVSDFFPNVRPIAAMKARVWVRQGKVDEALEWGRAQGLSVKDDLNSLREFEHITLARALLARHKVDSPGSVQEASGLLERLLHAAEEGGRTGSAIEILVLMALARYKLGDTQGALAPVERALKLAEPEGYVRRFVDEGEPMAALLQEALARRIAPSYVRQLLSSFGPRPDRPLIMPGMSEPLSEREREVLRLLGTDLSGPDMAGELGVSLNTLRTHTKSIYGKLAVNNRRAAVRRAGELGLIP